MTIPNKIFIIPYRNRQREKYLFEKHMRYVLEDIPSDTYKIYFVHQNDKKPFNRGAMKNIGFLAMRDTYPDNYKDITFIFNDVDTYPIRKNTFQYDTKQGIIKHFYGFRFALGGIFSINGSDFEKCGGFPNLWGWGLEDAIIQTYALRRNIKIDRDNFFDWRDSKNIIQRESSSARLTTKKEPWRFENNSINESYKDIHNLKYNLDNNYIQVINFATKFNFANDVYYYHNTKNGSAHLDPKFNPNPVNQHKDFNTLNNSNVTMSIRSTPRRSYKMKPLNLVFNQ